MTMRNIGFSIFVAMVAVFVCLFTAVVMEPMVRVVHATPLTPTAELVAPADPAGPILSTCGRGPVGSPAYDDINVGAFSPCATVDVAEVIAVLNTFEALPYNAIREFDRMFERDTRTGYQYRNTIPAHIGPAAPAQRLMWGSTSWMTATDLARVVKIRCDGSDPCIYVIADAADFNVGWPGRGLLMSEPLAANDFSWWGK